MLHRDLLALPLYLSIMKQASPWFFLENTQEKVLKLLLYPVQSPKAPTGALWTQMRSKYHLVVLTVLPQMFRARKACWREELSVWYPSLYFHSGNTSDCKYRGSSTIGGSIVTDAGETIYEKG